MPDHEQFDYWNDASTVDFYTQPDFLYSAERRLLGIFRDQWTEMDMLDLGVGGGRTSSYFAELARRHVGGDLSPGMIEACRKRFANRLPRAEFALTDVTDLADFKDNEFDLVMFTFNSIDSVELHLRAKALEEMKRVCKPGGHVFFATHNLYCIPTIPPFRPTLRPIKLRDEIKRWIDVRRKNMPLDEVMEQDTYVTFFDGSIGEHYLIFCRPEKQKEELLKMGYKDVRVFSILDGGDELTIDQAKNPAEPWLYYLCEV
jgi:ubiquinone/menaquinone biosynthesis C-methylase UbiE